MSDFIAPAIIGSAIVGGVTSLISANTQSDAAQNAAQIQADAATAAAQRQDATFQSLRGDVQPFINAGKDALNALAPMIGTAPGTSPQTAALTAPFNPTIEQLEKTPGYQFTLDQGQKAVANKFAGMGLGTSGALGKGLADYASGLASNTFQQQFNNYWNQNKSIFDMLSGRANAGQTAATSIVPSGVQSAAQTSQFTTQAAAAQAGGEIGSANALTTGLSNLAATTSNAAITAALGNKFGWFDKSKDDKGGSGSNSGPAQVAAPVIGGYNVGAAAIPWQSLQLAPGGYNPLLGGNSLYPYGTGAPAAG